MSNMRGYFRLDVDVNNPERDLRRSCGWEHKAQFPKGIYECREQGVRLISANGNTTTTIPWHDRRAQALAQSLTLTPETVQTALAKTSHGDPHGVLIHLAVTGRVSIEQIAAAAQEFDKLGMHEGPGAEEANAAELKDHRYHGYLY